MPLDQKIFINPCQFTVHDKLYKMDRTLREKRQKQIDIKKYDVDHFIPWSFIKDDQIWNFVLACPECNNKKRDKLAKVFYLNKISERNEVLIEKNTRDATDSARRIKMIYDWARNNGYVNTWEPGKVKQ